MSNPIQSHSHVVHSTQTMEFDPEVRQQIQNAQARRKQNGPRAVPVDQAPQVTPSPRVSSGHVQSPNKAPYVQPQQKPAIDPALVAAMSGHPPGHGQHMVDPGMSYGPIHREQQWFEPPKPMSAPTQDGTVTNPVPGFVVPRADANGTSVMLPSRFAFYGFEDLYICPFKSGHLAKLSRAHAESSLQQVVETVSTVIYTSTPDCSKLAFDLTLPDFYFVMYWLRQNSFTKATYIHKDICENKAHIDKVQSGELQVDSLRLTQVVNNSTVKTLELESIPDPEIFQFDADTPLIFNPPKMRDVLEFLDDPLMQDPNTRTEFSYLAQQAAHVQGRDQWLSLKDRIALVENLDLDSVLLINQYQKLLKSYGVQEKIRMNCKVCGASKDSILSLDASTFLSVE